MSVFRAGVIGCGRKGLTIDDEAKCPHNYCQPPASHAYAYATMPETELVAAADPDPAARAEMQARFPAVRVYDSYEEMLRRERLDIVSVATQASLHAPATIAAAMAGARAVISEKAMATSASEADAMISACRASGTSLAVDHPRRYHPTYAAAREALASGAIGPLRLIVASAVSGIVHNGTHFFDLFRFFAQEPASVTGSVRRRAEGDGDGWARISMDGCVAIMDAESNIEPGLMLIGERGRIEIDHSFPGYTLVSYAGTSAPDPEGPWFRGGPCRERSTRRVKVPVREPTMATLIRDVLGAASSGAQPRSTGEDGVAALEMAIGAFLSSAAGGAPISLPLRDRQTQVISR